MQSDDFSHLDSVIEKEEAFKRLEKCIEKLPDEQQQSIKLFYYESKCYNEIAETTSMDWNKVRSLIQNGRRNLKICMEKMQQTNTTYPFYGPEDIKRYLSGSMSAQEMHDMEKAALKDPLLADAIDGFRNADPVVTDTHLNAIKASILGLSLQEKPLVVPLTPSPKNPGGVG
ncbi:sigma-70 family RNA polymerase sigma factor [Niabella hibiscisoli]|uniref:sigma-70 family RNA polymerase sigma factor n=1 Tax=Niabella hibiscisoli TaxID=1825928 RepID=UPI001F118EFA|nr:sigma-70 family RNA polymerase sigma factor [Niabella hibiscisoli]MCH5720717.1 sigma-70 family RNA polymerase sigma factor [Niabella hibiscisoli]